MPFYFFSYYPQSRTQIPYSPCARNARPRSWCQECQYAQCQRCSGSGITPCARSTGGNPRLDRGTGPRFSRLMAFACRSNLSTRLGHHYVDVLQGALALRSFEEDASACEVAALVLLSLAGHSQSQLRVAEVLSYLRPILFSLLLHHTSLTPLLGSSNAQSMMIFLIL